MPARHAVFVVDLAELEKAFQLPLSVYVEEFLDKPSPGDRLREYAELAFANEQQIQTLRKADRETMVMARRLMVTGQGPRSELPAHMGDVTAEYIRTRTTSQFKWMIQAFAASGRPWLQEVVSNIGRDWVEEALNLLFTQRAFASSPEEAEEYRITREALLRFVGPFPVTEAGREVDDPNPVTEDSFVWLPREDGVASFRLVQSIAVPTLARTLSAVDFSPDAFSGAGRNTDPRLQDLVRSTVSKLRSFLALPYTRPAVLAFIGA